MTIIWINTDDKACGDMFATNLFGGTGMTKFFGGYAPPDRVGVGLKMIKYSLIGTCAK